MYCITFDMVETGIFYNKDIFRRLGLRVPKDWPEFMKAQEKIARAGLIPLLGSTDAMADWGMDLIFDQLYGGVLEGIDLVKDPIREQYLEGYLDWDEIAFLQKKGFFTRKDARYVETFRLMKDWRRYWQKNLASPELTKLFLTQRGAMMWNGSWMVNRMVRDPQVDFDWGVFYLPPMPKSFHRFADGHEMVVIGGSGTQFEITNSGFNDTGNPATSEKLKRCVAFLQFLCLPKNTEAVINEILAFLPNIKGVKPRPELLPFHEFLQRKYTTTKWLYTFDLRFNEIFRRMLNLYLDSGISEDEFMTWMESNVKTASETVVRRKRLDLAPYEAKWQELAPLRAKMEDLPVGN
jgi:raffinose/stachyose/melibiose transport system substrate-binding protein